MNGHRINSPPVSLLYVMSFCKVSKSEYPMVVLSDEHKEGPVNVWAEHCREHKRRKTNKVETGDDRRGMKTLNRPQLGGEGKCVSLAAPNNIEE